MRGADALMSAAAFRALLILVALALPTAVWGQQQTQPIEQYLYTAPVVSPPYSPGLRLLAAPSSSASSAVGVPASSFLTSVPNCNIVGGTGASFTCITAGTGLNLSGNVLTATAAAIPTCNLLGGAGSNYSCITAGTGLSLSGNVLSVTGGAVPTCNLLGGTGSGYACITAGTGLSLSGNVLSVTGGGGGGPHVLATGFSTATNCLATGSSSSNNCLATGM